MNAIPAHAIARALARALAVSPLFREACQMRCGAAPHVFLDAVGAKAWEEEGVGIYPFLVVSPEREDFGRGDRTLAVNVLLVLRADEAGSSKPAQAAGGWWELPGSDALQDLAAGLVDAVSSAEIPATLESWGADWDFGSEWPEQSALLTFNYRNLFSY